jgi:tetratricopeptide (TPR) repeat protein
LKRLNSFLDPVRRFLELQENRYATPAQVCAAFAGVALARNFLESVLEGEQILGFIPVVRNSFFMFFDHFFLFYASIFLWIIVSLSLLTGQEVRKTAGIVALFSPLILVPPIVDIFLSRGAGYRLGYLVGIREALPAVNLFDLRGQLVQVTWGQRIETIAVCYFAASYVWLKRNSWWKAVAAFVAVYFIGFVHGLPQALADIPELFGMKLGVSAIMGGGLVDVDSQNYSFYMLMFALPAALIMIRMHDRDIWRRFIQGLARGKWWAFGAASLVGLAIGYLFFKKTYHMTFVNPYDYLAFAATACAFIFSSARPRDSRLAALPAAFGFFLSINVGFMCLALAACVFILSRLRKTIAFALVLSFLGGLSLFAQEHTLGVFTRSGREGVAAFAQYRQAREFFIEQRWGEAVDCYVKAETAGLKKHELFERLAEGYVNLGQPGNAIEPFHMAIATSRNDPESYLGLAGIFLAGGNFNAAIGVYEKAIEKKIQPDRFHLEIGRMYFRMGDIGKAKSETQLAAIYGMKKDILYQSLADLAAVSSGKDSALVLYRKVLRYNPRFGLAYNGMAGIYYVEGNYAEAAGLYEKALELLPENPTILNNTGAVYIELGRLDDAYKLITRALAIYPMLAEGYYNLGRIFETKGAKGEAIKDYEKALEVNPELVGAREALKDLGVSEWKENR